ncbi:MAG: tRNA pseudouridine(55) synthase TruB [Candidatus Omnitrophica bacterium]|nr:tRNA pseudouridine(55) synthase TruB [Candidatus Omnitrophota bacterium]
MVSKEGIFIINKPKGMSSFAVVRFIRKQLGVKKIGHAGTLDPFASGVLIVLVGRYTKLFSQFLDYDKQYYACLCLGKKTTTADPTGKVIQNKDYSFITEEEVRRVLNSFKGELLQLPPMTSALKYKGKPLYLLSRKGIEIPRRKRKVNIKEIELIDFNLPQIRFKVTCSSGTYIRTLGEEIAERLGTVGFLEELERQAVGPYSLKEAITLEEVSPNKLILPKINF